MYGLDQLLVTADRERLRVRERELEFRGQPVRSHRCAPRSLPARWMRPACCDSTRKAENLAPFSRVCVPRAKREKIRVGADRLSGRPRPVSRMSTQFRDLI